LYPTVHSLPTTETVADAEYLIGGLASHQDKLAFARPWGHGAAIGIALALAALHMAAIDVVDGCAGRPAEGRRCESVTVKA